MSTLISPHYFPVYIIYGTVYWEYPIAPTVKWSLNKKTKITRMTAFVLLQKVCFSAALQCESLPVDKGSLLKAVYVWKGSTATCCIHTQACSNELWTIKEQILPFKGSFPDSNALFSRNFLIALTPERGSLKAHALIWWPLASCMAPGTEVQLGLAAALLRFILLKCFRL